MHEVCPTVRERVKEAKARREGALRAQLELAAFDDTPTNKDDGKLSGWSKHYKYATRVRVLLLFRSS